MYVYVLQHDAGYYVGITRNLGRRWKEHCHGWCKTTSRLTGLRPYKVWAAPGFVLASKLERYLHRRHGRELETEIHRLATKFPAGCPALYELAAHLHTTDHERMRAQEDSQQDLDEYWAGLSQAA